MGQKYFLSLFLLLCSAMLAKGAVEVWFPPTACFSDAYSEQGLFLTEEASVKLCSGAKSSTGPVDCMLQLTFPEELNVFDDDAIRLCAGAVLPLAPSECFWTAYQDEKLDLIFDEIIQLCGGAGSADAPIDCFESAREGLGLSTESALQLCSGS